MITTRLASALALLALGLGLAPAGGAQDSDTYDLLGPAPKKGQVITLKGKSTLKDAKVSVDDGNMKLDLDMETVSTSEKRIDILAVKGRQIEKAKMKVVKDEGTQTFSIGGMSQEKEEKSPLVDQTILLERAKDGWKRTLEDNADPTEAQKKKMASIDLDSWEEAVLPAKKVAVGHKWEVDASKLSRLFDSKFSNGSGKIKGHFVKLEKVGDERCAVIELELVDVKGTAEAGGDKLKVEFNGKVTVHRALSTGVNLRNKAALAMNFSGKNKTPDGNEIDLTIKGKMGSESTATVK